MPERRNPGTPAAAFMQPRCEGRRSGEAGSLPDLGNRSGTYGKSSSFLRSFEAHSNRNAMKKFAKMSRFPTAARLQGCSGPALWSQSNAAIRRFAAIAG
jgi:hypothetical protein